MGEYKKFRMPDEPEFEDADDDALEALSCLYRWPNNDLCTAERGWVIAQSMDMSESDFMGLVEKGFLVEVAEEGE